MIQDKNQFKDKDFRKYLNLSKQSKLEKSILNPKGKEISPLIRELEFLQEPNFKLTGQKSAEDGANDKH